VGREKKDEESNIQERMNSSCLSIGRKEVGIIIPHCLNYSFFIPRISGEDGSEWWNDNPARYTDPRN
jgi:hypothetical protein